MLYIKEDGKCREFPDTQPETGTTAHEGGDHMARQERKKFTLAMDEDSQVWLEFEAARRGISVTACINEAIREQRDNAPQAVRDVFSAFMDTRS